MKKKLNYIFIELMCLSFILCSCGVSGAEAVKCNDKILQDKGNGDVFNLFLEPEKIEESENTIITIKTNVPDVKVFLNNTYLGESDINITDLISGSYVLDLKKDGYKPVNIFVSVNKNRQYIYYIEMEVATEKVNN